MESVSYGCFNPSTGLEQARLTSLEARPERVFLCLEIKSMAERILRMKDVVERTGLCRAAIYRYIEAGKFPRQFNIAGGRAVGWKESQIDRWIGEQSKGGAE